MDRIEKLKKRLGKYEARLAEMDKKLDTLEDVVELRNMQKEINLVNGYIADIKGDILEAEAEEKRKADEKEAEERKKESEEVEERAKGPEGELTPLVGFNVGDGVQSAEELRAKEQKEKIEERGARLKEGRAVSIPFSEIEQRAITVDSTGIIMPKHTSPTLNEAPVQASNLYDYVDVVPLIGGEAFDKGFVKNYTAGSYTTDGADAAAAEPVFDFVNTGKSLITAYAEVSKGTLNLPNVNYESEVLKAVEIALKMRFNIEIIAGDGATGHLTGLLNSPANTGLITVEMSELDADSVDDIIFSVAGNKAVAGNGFLVINKLDLAALNKVRSNDGKKLYQIKLDDNGNTGTISSDETFSARFIIDDALPALSDSGTAVDTNCMVYGKMKGYHIPIFSEVVIERSTDHQFRKGLVAYRAEVYAGGVPAAYNNFAVVKKVAAV